MNIKETNTLRWLAVIPGGIIGGLLSTFVLHIILYIAFAHNGSLFGVISLPDGANLSIENAVFPAVVAMAFVLSGTKIAPRKRFRTALILAVLYSLFNIGVLILISNRGYLPGVRALGPIMGVLIALFFAWNDERRALRLTHIKSESFN